MITDDVRRERAKNLRDQAEAWRSMMPDIRMSDRRLTDSIHMAFGLDDVDITVHEALDMLADLIDPPITTRTCEKCGGEWPSDIMFECCPYCGTVVLDGTQN